MPGRQIRIPAYGPEQVAQVRNLKPGDTFDTVLTPISMRQGNTGYKLDELSNIVPAAVTQPAGAETETQAAEAA